MKELLRNRNAVMLWFSRTFSRFGDAFESLAFMYLVYELTGSALAMGTIMLFSVIPNVIVSPFAGVLGDRWNKKKIMFTSETVRAVTILALPVLHHMGELNMAIIYAAVLIVSVAESFFEPCAQVVMVSAVEKEQLPIYNSAVTTSNQIAKLVGYSAAGIIMKFATMDVLFCIDSITFWCSAIVVLFVTVPILRIDSFKQKDEQKEGIWDSLKGGIQFVYNEKCILMFMIIIMLEGVLLVPISQFLPQITKDIFRASDTFSGYVLTMVSVGTILGSVSYPLLLKVHIKLRQVLFLGNLMIGGFILGCIESSNVILGILLYIFSGLTVSIINIWCSTELQSKCKIEYLARVASLFSVIMVAADPISGAISGWAIDLFNIRNVLAAIAILFIIFGCIFYLYFKEADKREENNYQEVSQE